MDVTTVNMTGAPLPKIFQVIRQHWSDDGATRTIYEIRAVDNIASPVVGDLEVHLH